MGITRDTSESGFIEVEAENEIDAEDIARQQYEQMPTEQYAEFYEPDDSAGAPYTSGVEEI